MYTMLLLCFFFIDSELQKACNWSKVLVGDLFLDKAKASADVSATKSSGFSLVWEELFFPYAGIQVI